jgi:hypothetical protein
MNYVFVTRGNKKWLVRFTSADHLLTICTNLGWMFDSYTDVSPITANLYHAWKIGELIDEIGDGR